MDWQEIPLSRFTGLLHPYPTFLVTSARESGEVNVITIAWLMPVSVWPPLLTMAIRPERYSYGLLVESGEFVVNVLPYERAREALFCGRRSGRHVDKIAQLGLETAPGRAVRAPRLVGVAIAFLECRVRQQVQAGDHDLFIAEVLAAEARSDFFDGRGRNLAAARPLLHVGGNRFTTTVEEAIEPAL